MQNILSFVSGSLLAFLLSTNAAVDLPKSDTQETPIVKTVTVYTCATLPPQTSEDWQQPELHKLRESCNEMETAKKALALIEQWEKDPTAGIVYEEADGE